MAVVATSAFPLSEVGEGARLAGGEGQDLTLGFCVGKGGRGQTPRVPGTE